MKRVIFFIHSSAVISLGVWGIIGAFLHAADFPLTLLWWLAPLYYFDKKGLAVGGKFLFSVVGALQVALVFLYPAPWVIILVFFAYALLDLTTPHTLAKGTGDRVFRHVYNSSQIVISIWVAKALIGLFGVSLDVPLEPAFPGLVITGIGFSLTNFLLVLVMVLLTSPVGLRDAWQDFKVTFGVALLLNPTLGIVLAVAFHDQGLLYTLLLVGFLYLLHRYTVLNYRQVEQERQLLHQQHQLNLDALTGVFNYRYLNHYLEELTRKEDPFALLLMDLDHFKAVNDTYGHPAGNEVLVRAAESIRNSLRPGDTVARFGGEEFAAILLNISPEDARKVAERVREDLEGLQVTGDNYQVRLTISIGMAYYQPPMSLDELLASADASLYRAKGQGRNRVC